MDESTAAITATTAAINAVNETLKSLLKISSFIEQLVGKVHVRHYLDRQKIIRRLLRHCRSKAPEYNFAIFVPQTLIYYLENSEDCYFDKFEMQDFVSKFELEILAFKKGTITVLRSINDGKKWGLI
jgi:hypothetical protein